MTQNKKDLYWENFFEKMYEEIVPENLTDQQLINGLRNLQPLTDELDMDNYPRLWQIFNSLVTEFEDNRNIDRGRLFEHW